MKHLLLFFIFTFSICNGFEPISILQADIELMPSHGKKGEQVNPDTAVTITAKITNTGSDPSLIFPFYVRYAFPGVKDKLSKSEIFRTEEIMLPSIPPNKTIVITFQKKHRWPSIFEFIRRDWNLRQYQAIVEVNDQKLLLGTAAIAFHMHYYPGPKHEFPKELPGKEKILTR